MNKLYSFLSFACVLAVVSVFGQAGKFTTSSSPDGEPEVRQVMAQKGQTILDFMDKITYRAIQQEVNPGVDPEGDYVHEMAFSGDGAYLLQTNAVTDNVTVFDAETLEVMANVPVGYFPVSVACTEDYAIVPCVFADSVFVIDLSDFSIAGMFPTGEQPAVVKVSHDGTKAFVGCDVDDVLEVIDLENMQHEATITNFPVALRSANWITGSGRFYYTWRPFLVSPDDQHIITSNFDGMILEFDLTTGEISNQLEDMGFITELNFSGDGQVLVAVEYATPATVYQIDYNTFTVSTSLTFPDFGIWGGGVAVNPDGSKAFLGVNGNQTALVRFATEDYLLFPVTQTAFWCDNTYDHQYAVSGQFRFSIFDFEEEAVKCSYWGISQYLGAVSPTEYKAAGVDPGRFEGPAFYEFTDPQVVNLMGQMPSGEVPEGDVPYRAAVAQDGSKAVVVNNLSETVSIINCENYELEDVIDIGEAGYEVAITHDSKWAIVGGYDLNSVKIISLETNELVTTVGTGQRPMMITIAPDDSYAYVGNLKGNTVAFVKLDGANSVNEKIIPVGTIGLNWSAFGVRSGVKVSPTGEYLLVAASFDDNVKVIDTELQEIVATVNVGDFPLQLDFNADGTYAVVLNYSDNTYSVIHVDGANSSLVGTFPAGNTGPIRLKYNPVKEEMSIVHLNDSHVIMNIDPETGDVLSTFSYPQHGSPMQIDFDASGLPLVLTSSTDDKNAALLHDNFAYELPSSPIQFGFSEEAQIAVVAEGGGGPDNVSIVDLLATGIGDSPVVTNVKLKPIYITSVSPNPASENVEIRFWKNESLDLPVSMKITDVNGNEVHAMDVQQMSNDRISLNVSGLNTGVYFVTLIAGNHSSTKKLVVR